VIEKVQEYIEMPEFSDPSSLERVNKTGALLYEWVCAISECSRLKTKSKSSNNIKTFYSLTEFIESESYFMFAWPLYYGPLKDTFSEKVDDLLGKVHSSKTVVVGVEELCESIEGLSSEIEIDTEVIGDSFKLAQRFSWAEAAKGNWLFDSQVSGFIVNDLGWFMRLLDKLSSFNVSQCKALTSIVGRLENILDLKVFNEV